MPGKMAPDAKTRSPVFMRFLYGPPSLQLEFLCAACHLNAARSPSRAGDAVLRGGELKMLDVVLVASGLALFALAIAYAFACDRL